MDFATALQGVSGSPAIDPAAVVAYLAFKYLLGDRTLVAGLNRAPWMSVPGDEDDWATLPLPEAGTRKPPVAEIAEALHDALLEECREYVAGAGRVGLLLSGGMDSRIVAGVLRQIQLENGGAPDVLALTWGLPDTRDVLYARRVADGFGWDWEHFPLTAESLWRNVLWVGHHGCEVAPVHLHALPDVGALEGLDVVLAGSYGDSIGRAEFSGRHLTALQPVDAEPLDPFGIVRGSVLRSVRPEIAADAGIGDAQWPQLGKLRKLEIAQQLHYMRRKLQSCMATALGETRLCQLFTSPRVVDLMWGLSPSVRDDGIYLSLLQRLDNELAEIPWARTGCAFGGPDEGSNSTPSDDAPRQHHRYGAWLREDLGDEIAARAGSKRVLESGLFIPGGLRRLLKIWRRGRTISVGLVDEIVCWLASFDVLLETYRIEGIPAGRPSPADEMRSLYGSARAQAYTIIRSRLRD